MEKTKDISLNLDTYFPNIYKKIAVSFSAGLESSLILLICIERYGKNNVYVFSQKNVTTDNSPVPIYHRYVNAITKKLNLKNYQEIEIDITNNKTLTRNGVKEEFLLRVWNSVPNLDKIFVGANIVRYGYCSSQEWINGLNSYLQNNQKIFAPFLNLHKEDTIKAYYDLGYQEYIMLTRSCHQPSMDPCGVCSNCLDRIDGFKFIGKNDPTIAERTAFR